MSSSQTTYALGALFWFAAIWSAVAAEGTGAEELPELRPPKGAIPPSFWEQNGALILIGASVAVLVTVFVVWLIMRPVPPEQISAEARAKRGIEKLGQQPETGAVISELSQIVRYYFIEAFGLPNQEFTTSEFGRAVKGDQNIGPELGNAVTEFLRRCDQLKFAPIPGGQLSRSVTADAYQLIERGEARLAEVRRSADQAKAPAANTQRA